MAEELSVDGATDGVSLWKQSVRVLETRAAVVAVALLASLGCQDDESFQFKLSINNYSDPGYEIWVDDERVTGGTDIGVPAREFGSYGDALDTPIRVETRRDGDSVSVCDVYAGACGDDCVPDRVTASVCVMDAGQVFLNTWDCPCNEEGSGDLFCGGECSITAP